MDALQMLTDDHDVVRELFDRFRAANDAKDDARMRSLQESIFDELETHTRIEEEVIYPRVRELGVEELTELVAESAQEHHVVTVLIREVRELTDMEVFAAKMTVLIENVEHHADEEESEMFPLVREHLDTERLEEMGAELEAAKSNA